MNPKLRLIINLNLGFILYEIHRELLLLHTARGTNSIAELGQSWDSYRVCPIVAG